MKTIRCEHAPCSCAAQEGTRFCSDACASAQGGDREQTACVCGHPECAAPRDAGGGAAA